LRWPRLADIQTDLLVETEVITPDVLFKTTNVRTPNNTEVI